ncbi:hypothetical protein Y032_0090g2375 [Ancylostoma ceylanicum]|uniref:Uncharacterized protein n=1 Tax=Ancylostoma ceylanicum TaxID=53326 RepID=A0A016TM42_9BILA|nr:hypothetical protein Y032_0090g2375 [Ancylostoma ceylanicum]
MNVDGWERMGSPKFKDTSLVVKDANGNQMKVYSELTCKFRLKGVIGEGKCYVIPHKSLVGLDGIQQNDEMAYHLDRMVAHISTKGDENLIVELKQKFESVFQDGPGTCTKEKAALKLLQGAKPVYRMKRLLAHASLEVVEKKIERLVDVGVIEPSTQSEWSAPIVCVRKVNGEMRVCADFSTGLGGSTHGNFHVSDFHAFGNSSTGRRVHVQQEHRKCRVFSLVTIIALC